MRTTLEIDDVVLLAAEEIARRENTTPGAVISELARQTLKGMATEASRVAEPPVIYGFQPLAADGRVISNEAIGKIREEEGV